MQFIKEIGKCKEENNSMSFKTQKQTKPNRLKETKKQKLIKREQYK